MYSIFSIVGFIFGMIGFMLGLFAVIKVCAFEKSTHKIEYRPLEEYHNVGASIADDEELNADLDEEQIELIKKKEKKRVDAMMESFSNSYVAHD